MRRGLTDLRNRLGSNDVDAQPAGDLESASTYLSRLERILGTPTSPPPDDAKPKKRGARRERRTSQGG